ncbi:MAG TPA: SpoIID/LytB domain-containing protein, partial [Blastocatellia bacterium]|nr:SpoIID/LytB domain-containing protein [Blastocatellia bacterium]
MSNAFAILTLLVSPSLATLEAATVRIGLFSLFRPEAITVRIPAGAGALFEASRVRGDHSLPPGDLLQLRLTSGRIRVAHIDSHGRVRQSLTTDSLEIIPKDGGTLELSIPGKIKRAVRGRLRVNAGDKQSTLTIALTTDREAAVASIVAAEMTPEREAEALKAVAVVVRAYMLSHGSRHAGEGFDFCDTTHCQVYRGESDLSAQSPKPVIAAAVAETSGEYLSYRGRKIETYYTAACGGL